MVRTLNDPVADSLTPREALDAADRELDPTSLDSLIDNAWILRALANDSTFLPELVNEDLKRALEGGTTHIYSPQSMLLGQGPKATFRANLWYPASPDAERDRLEKKLYSYELPHDHNFHFATVGYFGPGYRTDIYRYDRQGVKGLIGEKVDLRFSETTELTVGKVLVFESGRDVHTQYTPPSLSISLNLICRDPVQAAHPQYLFDLATSKIVRLAEQRLTRGVGLLRFAKFLGNEETIELVDAIASSAAQPILRAASFDALMRLAPVGDKETIERRIGDDRDPFMAERIAQIGVVAL
jgi:hypothetical protein